MVVKMGELRLAALGEVRVITGIMGLIRVIVIAKVELMIKV
jgi:hypothetical protein